MLLLSALLSLLTVGLAQQSGGSFGGGGFGNQNPPAPSGGGGGGNDIFSLLPYFFWSGGGTTGAVIVLALVLAPIIWRWWQRNANRQGLMGAASQPSAALKVQLMLLEAETVKADLRQLAERGETTSPQGLTQMMREAVLSVMRHPERWVYGTVELAGGSDAQSSQRVAAWATSARAAYTVETTSNQGRLQQTEYQAKPGGTYCVVTFVVAARDFLLPHVTPPVETAVVRSALEAVAGITPDNLIDAQVVWTPDAPGEFLSEDQALRLYPTLYRL